MNSNLSVPLINPITFIDTSGDWPNDINTLHINMEEGNRMILPYCHKFILNDIVPIQVNSKTDELPILRAFDGAILIETITGELARTITGNAGIISYFNFLITLDIKYYNKEIEMTITQGSDIVYSEPIYVSDYTREKKLRTLRKVEYTNFNRQNTDLFGGFIDWGYLNSNVDRTMFFYIECVSPKPANISNAETLQGSQTITLISATLFGGKTVKCDPMPLHMFNKLELVLKLDFISINDLELVVEGGISDDMFADTTSIVPTFDVKIKKALGINVNTLGYESTFEEMAKPIITVKKTDQVSGFDIEIPAGYMLHVVNAKKSATSSTNIGTLSGGTTAGGTDLIDPYNGEITDADLDYSFALHYLPVTEAGGRLYIAITGTGVKLDVTVSFVVAQDNAATPQPPTPPDPETFADMVKAGNNNLASGNNTITFAKPFNNANFVFKADGYTVGTKDKVEVYWTSQTKEAVIVYVPEPCIIYWQAIKF